MRYGTEKIANMMTEESKWKSKLLSSSTPLEYEVAKTLVSKGFSVTADYSYAREDEGRLKDFSVDISAYGFPPFNSENNLKSTFSLLVECKYRHRGITWLFFPDPNEDTSHVFLSGSTLHAVDEFSPKFFPYNCTGTIEDSAPYSFKGVEVNVDRGDVHDAEIRRGLLQIQYALPRVLTREIMSSVTLNLEDNLPFFFCGMVVTTAPLMLAREGLTMADVEKAVTLGDIAEPVPWLIACVDPASDFIRHRANACAPLRELAHHPLMAALDQLRATAGENEYCLPSTMCRELADENSGRGSYFRQIIVCSFEHLDDFLEHVKNISSRAVRGLRDTRPETPWERRERLRKKRAAAKAPE